MGGGKTLGDRGLRADDADPKVFETRIREFHEKTMPVLQKYNELGLLIQVKAEMSREEVYQMVIESLYTYARERAA